MPAPLNVFSYGDTIGKAQGIKNLKTRNALMEQELGPNSLNALNKQYRQKQIEEIDYDMQNPGGATYGKQIQYAMDGDKLRGFTVGDDASLVELKLPPGMTWADTYTAKDMGSFMALFGKRTGYQGGPSIETPNPDLTDIPPVSMPSQQQTGLGGVMKTIPPQDTPQHKAAVEAAVTNAANTANLTGKPPIAGAEVTAKGQATRQQEWIDSGIVAADAYPVVGRGLELLMSGVKTGGWDSIKLKATDLFGVTGADEAELSYNLGKNVLSQLRSTFGAAFTAKEGEQLKVIEAGFGKSVQGNIRLLEQAQKILDRAMKRGEKAAGDAGDTVAMDVFREARQFSLTPEKKETTFDDMSIEELEAAIAAEKAK